ncbi:MAG: nucleotidyltransferase family protein [Acidobacteriota bacterium]
MTQAQQIRAHIRRHKRTLRKEYGVRTLGLFGSYVRNQQGPRSDIDILVEFEAPIGLLQFNKLERQLGEILGGKVDLVMKSALKPHIGRRILEEVVPL